MAAALPVTMCGIGATRKSQPQLESKELAEICARLGGPWVKQTTWSNMGWLINNEEQCGEKRRRIKARRARMQRMRDACSRMRPWLCEDSPANWNDMYQDVLLEIANSLCVATSFYSGIHFARLSYCSLCMSQRLHLDSHPIADQWAPSRSCGSLAMAGAPP